MANINLGAAAIGNAPPFDAAFLRSLYTYDAETGAIRHARTRGKGRAGDYVGSERHDGYLTTTISTRPYMVHRLVWMHVHGTWPEGCIDHINRNRADNRIENLRVVSFSENKENTGVQANSVSGIKGVQFLKSRNQWRARIQTKGQLFDLGRFNSAEEAGAAYTAAAARLHKYNPVTEAAPALLGVPGTEVCTPEMADTLAVALRRAVPLLRGKGYLGIDCSAALASMAAQVRQLKAQLAEAAPS